MSPPRAGFAVTPQGAALAVWQSQSRGALEWFPLDSKDF